MIRTGQVWLAACVMAVLFASEALDHSQNTAVTEDLFNPRSGMIEVAHRFSLHDAEAAVFDAAGARRDLAVSSEAQAAFASYVASRFALGGADGAEIELVVLGTEVEGAFLWVYQEGDVPPETSELRVRHAALQDVWPQQINQVNVKRGDMRKTLVFVAGAGEQRASLTP